MRVGLTSWLMLGTLFAFIGNANGGDLVENLGDGSTWDDVQARATAIKDDASQLGFSSAGAPGQTNFDERTVVFLFRADGASVQLAAFSDDGISLTIADLDTGSQSTPLSSYGQGQALPDLGQSLKLVSQTFIPGHTYYVSAHYLNTLYTGDGDIDGLKFFSFGGSASTFVGISKIIDVDTDLEGTQPDDSDPLMKLTDTMFTLQAIPNPDSSQFESPPQWEVIEQPSGSSLGSLGFGVTMPLSLQIAGDYTLRAFTQAGSSATKKVRVQTPIRYNPGLDYQFRVDIVPVMDTRVYAMPGQVISCTITVADMDCKYIGGAAAPEQFVTAADIKTASMRATVTPVSNVQLLDARGNPTDTVTLTVNLIGDSPGSGGVNRVIYETGNFKIRVSNTLGPTDVIELQAVVDDQCDFVVPNNYAVAAGSTIRDGNRPGATKRAKMFSAAGRPAPLTMILKQQIYTDPLGAANNVQPPGQEFLVGSGIGMIQNVYKCGPDLNNDGVADSAGQLIDEDIVYTRFDSGGLLSSSDFNDQLVATVAQETGLPNPSVDDIVQFIESSDTASVTDSTFPIDGNDQITDTYSNSGALKNIRDEIKPAKNSINISLEQTQTYSCAAATNPNGQGFSAPTMLITDSVRWRMINNTNVPVEYMKIAPQ